MARKRVDGRFVKDGETAGESEPSECAKPGRPMRAPRPRQCRAFVRKRIAERMPARAEMLMKQANEGCLGHLKILVGLAGLDKGEVTPAVKRREKSLETILLEQWAKDDEVVDVAVDGEMDPLIAEAR